MTSKPTGLTARGLRNRFLAAPAAAVLAVSSAVVLAVSAAVAGGVRVHRPTMPLRVHRVTRSLKDIAPAATGFFQVGRIGGHWWFIRPTGGLLFVRGVHGIRFDGDRTPQGTTPYRDAASKDYGDEKAWAAGAAQNIQNWGFNTIGANSDSIMFKQGMPYTVLLDMSKSTRIRGVDFPDVFDTEWIDAVGAVARKQCARFVDDPNLIGYFSDNEMHWSGDYKTKENLVQLYLTLPRDSQGYQRAEAYVEAHQIDPRAMTYHDADGFQEEVARQYFTVTHNAIRAADPNHLILGCRFATPSLYDPVLRGIEGNVDVVSWNYYRSKAPVEVIEHIMDVTGRPVIISEFSFEAKDSGLPNTVDANDPVDTQKQRADLIDRYTRDLFLCDDCVGYIWFKYADDPAQGSGTAGGENCNYGLMSIQDKPYDAVTRRFQDLNGQFDHEIQTRFRTVSNQ